MNWREIRDIQFTHVLEELDQRKPPGIIPFLIPAAGSRSMEQTRKFSWSQAWESLNVLIRGSRPDYELLRQLAYQNDHPGIRGDESNSSPWTFPSTQSGLFLSGSMLVAIFAPLRTVFATLRFPLAGSGGDWNREWSGLVLTSEP